ncbi:hypothetical protein ATY29_28695 [Rhizobium hidalgonense]|nr:hypothetical protein ATY29_28695 [Rhizobium hidalgonense]
MADSFDEQGALGLHDVSFKTLTAKTFAGTRTARDQSGLRRSRATALRISCLSGRRLRPRYRETETPA